MRNQSTNPRDITEKSISRQRSAVMLLVMFALSGWMVCAMLCLQWPPIYTMLVALIFLVVVGLLQKKPWHHLEQVMIHSLGQAVPVMVMLLMIGILVAVWTISGTIPTMLYYTLHHLSPRWFLVSCVMMGMIVSSFTGSSVTTVSTIGVVFIGMAKLLDLPLGMAAGAIICGACFGDKCSPLSDTTNLAPSIARIDILTHVRHLMGTTLPALCITLCLFAWLGDQKSVPDTVAIERIKCVLEQHFNLSLWTFLPPLVMMIFAYKRISPLLTFALGIFFSLGVGFFTQQYSPMEEWTTWMKIGYSFPGSDETVQGLLNKGGMDAMFPVMLLVGIAFAFGSLWQEVGLNDALVHLTQRKSMRKGPAVCLTAFSCFIVNFLVGEQYLSIVLPGQLFLPFFKRSHLPRKYLSRTLEDCGTLVNPLIPWGVCASLYSQALGVSPMGYIPYAFFLYLSPLFTVLLGFWGRQVYTKDEEELGSKYQRRASK